MAIPFGKLTILVGAGIIGSVLAKEGRMSDVSGLVSGAFKIAWKQIRRDESSSPVRKPQNDSLMAQVNNLRQELQLLASSRPVTIVTSSGTGANRYGIIIVIVVVGYGYVWWKGWKLPDMMFATRRSLSDACTSIAHQLENVYASIRNTRRQLSSSIDRVDSNLNEVAQLTANTQERMTELRDGSERMGHDVRYVRDAVETLELKISRIEGKQDLTNLGVKKLVDYAYNLENNLLEVNTQASPSSSQVTFSSIGSLPPPSPRPGSNGSLEVPRPLENTDSTSDLQVQCPQQGTSSTLGQQRNNGISGIVEGSSNADGFRTPEGVSRSSSWFRPAFLSRTFSATNSVQQQTGSSRQ